MLGMPVDLAAVLVIGGAMILSVIGLLATRRAVKLQLTEGHNDIAGFIFATVGVVYAVVLGFVVITVWQRFADASSTVTDEAAALVVVFRDSQILPEPYRDQAQAAIRAYAGTVPAEWANHGILTVHKTPDPLNAVWNVYRAYEPKTPVAEDDLSHAKDDLTHLEEIRHQTHLSGSATLPAVFWALLVAGGVVTIGFTYFFHLENVRAHALMIAILAGGIAALLFGILALNQPFNGLVRVSDYPFQHALQQFNALTIGSNVP